MTLDELERAAMQTVPTPSELTLPQRWLYLALMNLYKAYRSKLFTREQAQQEKHKLMADYQRAEQWYELFRETAQMRVRLSAHLSQITKAGCPMCRKAVDLFDGRDR